MTVRNNINNSGEMVSSQSYNGAIVKVDTIGFEKDLQYTAYRVTLKPWLELLKHSQSFRVYQNQTTKEIVTDIFDKAGFKGCYKGSNHTKEKGSTVFGIMNLTTTCLGTLVKKAYIITSNIAPAAHYGAS